MSIANDALRGDAVQRLHSIHDLFEYSDRPQTSHISDMGRDDDPIVERQRSC